jgi:ComF family protein
MFTTILRDFLDFIFPKICVSCEKERLSEEKYLCISCMVNLPKTESHSLVYDSLKLKFFGKIPVQEVYAFLNFTKTSIVQNILYAIKYKNKPELAEILGKWYSVDLKSIKIDSKVDIIVPVPMFIDKQKQRGYNQAEEFAKGLAYGLELNVDTQSLKKIKATVSQTKTGGRLARFKNASGVFKVENNDNIEGKSVLLVDDVLTSGATLEVAAQALLDAGCKEIYIAVIAVAI